MYLLDVFYTNAATGIVSMICINSIAYRLFQALCFVFRLNTMSREDGLTSILRGFKKKNCYNFQKKLNFKTIKFIGNGLFATNG
jgi:hypothetical protein